MPDLVFGNRTDGTGSLKIPGVSRVYTWYDLSFVTRDRSLKVSRLELF